jgi:hypothetical protein
MFMDDVALVALTQPSLQVNTDRYAEYCRRWRSTLNGEKFQLAVFGKQLSPTDPPSIMAPGSANPVVATKYVKYLGTWLDYRRTSSEHIRSAEQKASTMSGLILSIANNLGTNDAAYVMDRKAIPHSLFGLEATWPDDTSIQRLDESVTGKLAHRAYALPHTSRKDIRLYQSGSLHASRIVRLASVRFAAKLARDPNPIRRTLFNELVSRPQVRPGVIGRIPSSSRLITRVNRDLNQVMPSPDQNPLRALTRTPYRGPQGVTRHRLSSFVSQVKKNLVTEQVCQLTADLEPHRTDGIKGRKSTFLFATMARPIPPSWGGTPVYSEGQKTQGLGPYNRTCVDRIRYGDFATPVNPIHNYRQQYAMAQAGAVRRRARNQAKPSGPRPIGVTVHSPPRVQTTAQAKADRLALAQEKRAALATAALVVPPSCVDCGLHIPDAYHLTFECPATLPQRSAVLHAITTAAANDPLIGGLVRGASPTDVLMASLGGTPMRHVPPDHPSYEALVSLAAPNWVSQFKHICA